MCAAMSNRPRTSSTTSNEDGIHLNSLFRLPQEIVEDILQRLPPKSLIQFSCLSKQCKSIIFNPKFILHYKTSSASSHLRGLFFPFVTFTMYLSYCFSKYAMKCRKLKRPHLGKLNGILFYLLNDFSRRKEGEYDHSLIASSNGLVLSLFSPLDHKFEYCVTNPLTNQSVKLPPLLSNNWLLQSGFATRQTEINGFYHVSYKVVVFTSDESANSCSVHIFCSDTGCWTSPVSGLSKLLINSSKGQDFCHKGILYWFEHKTNSIATYDPYDAPDRFRSIQLPNVGSDEGQKGISLVHLGQEDSVRYCEIKKQDEVSILLVWGLVEGEWFLQRRCPISPLCSVESWFLSHCRQLVCVNPSKSRLVSYMYARRSGLFTAIDLQNGREKTVKSYGEFHTLGPDYDRRHPFVPVVFCPWSSPLYRQLH